MSDDEVAAGEPLEGAPGATAGLPPSRVSDLSTPYAAPDDQTSGAPFEADWAPPNAYAWPAPTAAPPATAVSSRERRKPLRVLTAAAVVVVAAGSAAGIVLATSGGGTTGVLPSGPPGKVVLTAASRASQTSDVNINVSGSFTGIPSIGTLTISGSGQGDLRTHTFKMSGTFQGGPSALNGQQVNAIYVGSHIYEWSPLFSAYFPGKQWIEIPYIKASGTQSLGGNPAAELELLAQRGNEVRATGAATINGVLSEGYDVKFNATGMQRELAAEHLPAAFGQQVTAGLRQLHGVSLSVWVSGKQLVQMTEHVRMRLLGALVTATLTYNFQYTGMAVHIAAPTSGVVRYNSFEQLVRSQS